MLPFNHSPGKKTLSRIARPAEELGIVLPGSPEIIVVGSINVDLVATVTSLPKLGETVLARTYTEYSGGKGGNQAIAAARLGGRVAFVGRTGDDAAAGVVRSALVEEGVDVSECRDLPGEATGRALIMVDAQAENSIVVVAGANACLRPEHVDDAAAMIRTAQVVVAQLEVPVDTVLAAARHVTGTFVFNPAPAQRLPAELLGLVDVLVVNEGEYEIVSGRPTTDDLAAMSVDLRRSNLPASVVVTLGGRGALVWHERELSAIAAPAVTVVDTTGAGDTFVGALARALAREESLLPAAHWAVCAASLSTRALGATTGMPGSAEVSAVLASVPSGGKPEEVPMR